MKIKTLCSFETLGTEHPVMRHPLQKNSDPNHIEGTQCLHLQGEVLLLDILQNVSKLLPIDMMSHHRRPDYSAAPL